MASQNDGRGKERRHTMASLQRDETGEINPMTLFNNKYRIESARLATWDYSNSGYYFITVCTHDRKCNLSHIQNGAVVHSPIGNIINEEWIKTGLIRENVSVHDFVIMPNHIHGILQIKPVVETPLQNKPQNDISEIVETPCHGVLELRSGQRKTPYHGVSTGKPNPNNWKSGVLGAIIGQFKIQVTKRARHNGFADFQWQSRFHDHIIRNRNELFLIRQYIRNNPANWDIKDEFNDAIIKSHKSWSPWYVRMV